MIFSRHSTTTSSIRSIQGWRDVAEAFKLAWRRQKGHLFTSWVHVPLGVMFLLVVTWAFRLLIDLAPFRFPAPVIVMLLFFVALLALDWLSLRFPGHRQVDTEKAEHSLSQHKGQRKRFLDPIMALLAPPCEFCLRNMSVMFTPSFILIPAREIIPGKEIGLLTAWFLITQVLAFIFPVLFLWGMDWTSSFFTKKKPDSIDASGPDTKATISNVAFEKGLGFSSRRKLGPLATGLSGITANVLAPISHLPMDVDADCWRHLESTALEQARQQGDPAAIGRLTYRNFSPRSDVSTFQHHHRHRPRRSKTSPAGATITTSEQFPPAAQLSTFAKDDIDLKEEDADATRVNSRRSSLPDLSRRGSKVNFEFPSSDKMVGQSSDKPSEETTPDDDEDPVERLSSWISDLVTPTIYFILFIVGIPVYFVADVALPLFLGINILTFIAAITLVPPKVRRFLHPILSCSIATVLIIWAFGAMRGIGIKDNLNRFYSVDTRYSDLWRPSGYRGPVPGAGDVLFSTLDAGIVALAVPMYRNRSELRANFVKMVIVLSFCATLSLFLWNSIAALMGMDETRSLAFTARFMSTPLAIELAGNIGADESITVILVVLTGIIAAILKDHFFRLMRVDREDHLIVGITMGSTAGAIGASSLISTPKVMAVASLSFVIFGSILLIATAIPPIVDIVQMLA